MRGMNPFAALTHDIAQKVLEDHRLKRQAEKRLETLLAGYRELMEDARYTAIRQELVLAFGEQLRALVERAKACRSCASVANRIVLMEEVISAPLETVWFEQHRAPAEDEDAESPSDNGHD